MPTITHTGSFTLSFQNEHIIQENEVRCIVRESEYNLSYNPSLVTGSYSNGVVRGFATSASFHPYVTTIGLYNDNMELLAVAKMSRPLLKDFTKEALVRVKLDF